MPSLKIPNTSLWPHRSGYPAHTFLLFYCVRDCRYSCLPQGLSRSAPRKPLNHTRAELIQCLKFELGCLPVRDDQDQATRGHDCTVICKITLHTHVQIILSCQTRHATVHHPDNPWLRLDLDPILLNISKAKDCYLTANGVPLSNGRNRHRSALSGMTNR